MSCFAVIACVALPETQSVESDKLAGELKARDVSQGRHFHPCGRAGRLAAIR